MRISMKPNIVLIFLQKNMESFSRPPSLRYNKVRISLPVCHAQEVVAKWSEYVHARARDFFAGTEQLEEAKEPQLFQKDNHLQSNPPNSNNVPLF